MEERGCQWVRYARRRLGMALIYGGKDNTREPAISITVVVKLILENQQLTRKILILANTASLVDRSEELIVVALVDGTVLSWWRRL